MTLSVFDDDVGKDDKVGSNVIKLSSLCVNGGLDEWF
jgi:Ca2+-dependent lipid-binding protein